MSRKKSRIHYIEYKYPTYILVEKIEHRDPNVINIRMDAVAFRFFDKNLVECNGKMIESDKSRVSCWYYIGKRLHVHDIFSLKDRGQSIGYQKIYDEIKTGMESRGTPYVCDTLNGEIIYLNPEDRVLDDFLIDKYKERKCVEMFKKLKQHINKEVEYTLLVNGRVITKKGVLTEIIFFSHVKFRDLMIPFVDNYIGLMCIKYNGEVLFENKYLSEKSCLVGENIRKVQADLYGCNVANKKKYRRDKNIKREAEENKKAKESAWDINKSASGYIDFGKRWDWSYYLMSCCNDYRTCRLLKIAILCMEALHNGKSHITINYFLHKYKLNEEERKMVVGTVLYFSCDAEKTREFFLDEQIEFNSKILKLHLKNTHF